MVKNYTSSNMSLEQIANETSAGDVIEMSNGLYVNNGTELKKLNMTKEQYVALFPPVMRYTSEQGQTGDCYFVAGILSGYMENPRTYAELLQMFDIDSQTNDITITFKGLPDYPVTFSGGELFSMDLKGQFTSWFIDRREDNRAHSGITGSTGCKLLEQAFAIATFASEENKEISTVDIDDAMSLIGLGSCTNIAQNTIMGKMASTYINCGIEASPFANISTATFNQYNNDAQ